MALQITNGQIARPQKIVIYGAEGIGKSTLAAQLPEPLFLDTEGGTSHLNVRRAQIASWPDLLAGLDEVAANPALCKTVVVDTADWAEQLCTAFVLTKFRQPSIEAFGYGKGYTYLQEEFAKLLSSAGKVISAGIHVCLVAHAKMRKQELPDEMGAFDRWEMKLSRQVAPLVKEWADALLFLNYKTYVQKTEAGAHKASGGRRVIYTSHHPCWDAKNRHGLAPELELSYESIAPIFNATPDASPAMPTAADTLTARLAQLGKSEQDLRGVISSSKNYRADMTLDELAALCLPRWEKISTRLIGTN